MPLRRFTGLWLSSPLETDRGESKQDLEAEKAFFGRLLAADYTYDRGVYAGLKEVEYLEIFDRYLGGQRRYRLALDIGAGVGLSSVLLGKYAERVFTMDLSVVGFSRLPAILRPGEKMPQPLGGDAARAPFAADTFDVVFACGLLHHIPNWPVVIPELARQLKADGRLLLVEPNLLNMVLAVNFIKGRRQGILSPNEFPVLRRRVSRHCLRYFSLVESDYLSYNHQLLRLRGLENPGLWDRFQLRYYAVMPRPLHSQFFAVACQNKR